MSKVRLHVVKPSAAEAGTIPNEPTWEGGVSDYKKELAQGLNWHAYVATPEDKIKYMEEWVKTHSEGKKEEEEQALAAIAAAPKWKFSVGSEPSLARMILQGFPGTDKDENLITKFISGLVKDYLNKPAREPREESEKPKVSVQDRIRAQVANALGEIDEAADILTDGDEIEVSAMQEVLLAPEFKGPHLRFIVEHLDTYLKEWRSVERARKTQDTDEDEEQLLEGYSHISTRALRTMLETFEELRSGCAGHQAAAKAGRVRKRKPQDKRKVVARFRYMAHDSKFGLKSVDPVEVIGASELWVWDSKRRRIGHYVAEAPGSLYIQGVKVRGFNPSKSESKALRVGVVQDKLDEFGALRKNQTQKWFDNIRAKPAPLNGGSRDYILLLRVD